MRADSRPFFISTVLGVSCLAVSSPSSFFFFFSSVSPRFRLPSSRLSKVFWASL